MQDQIEGAELKFQEFYREFEMVAAKAAEQAGFDFCILNVEKTPCVTDSNGQIITGAILRLYLQGYIHALQQAEKTCEKISSRAEKCMENAQDTYYEGSRNGATHCAREIKKRLVDVWKLQ